MTILDNIVVSYSSMDELFERQAIIEKTIVDYVDEKNMKVSYETSISMTDDRYFLTITLLKK